VLLQELRKASGQQLREVQMTQGEAVKQLRDERQQAEKKEAQLKVSSSSSMWPACQCLCACLRTPALLKLTRLAAIAGSLCYVCMYILMTFRVVHAVDQSSSSSRADAKHNALMLLCCVAVQADNEQLEASLAAANSQVAKLQQQLNSLNELQQGLQASLQGKQSAEASLMTQLTQVRYWQV
jgi:hypothetical protein